MQHRTSARSRWLLTAVAITAFVMFAITPAQAFTVTKRIEVFKPNGSGGWTALDCSSGSVSVNGVGNIRVLAYAKWSGTTPKTDAFFFTALIINGRQPWYTESISILPANNVEVLVHDTVQDLKLGETQDEIRFSQGGSGIGCVINASNIPNPDEAQKSARTAYVNSVTSLRWEIHNYGSGALIPCGSSTAISRVSFKLFAVAPVTGNYDFHVHQEIPVASGKSGGPDQMPPPTDVRFWEQGLDGIPLVAGVETDVLRTTAADTFGPGTVTFHGMQQHSPAQTQFVETLCTITVT